MKPFNQNFKNYILSGEHKKLRTDKTPDASKFTSGAYHRRAANRLAAMLEIQDTVFIPSEMFIPTRTTKCMPDFMTENDPEIKNKVKTHEIGWLSNINPDYATMISKGLLKVKEEILVSKEKSDSEEKREYADSLLISVDAILNFAERYRIAALEAGEINIATVLERVPAHGAATYYEALQMFRIIHFCLWLEGNYHITVGRFDQYMLPYLQHDLDNGTLDYDTALEMTENFFISFNKDSDMYMGIQQGDNGQSMMLGGYDADGNDMYNTLSEICLKASLDVKLIDPKINLRVNKTTPMDRLIFASRLTAAGLGFPQYSNDDIVIPGLEALGYDKEDALNYTVAACWEFIIPGLGMDIPNIGVLSFADVVNTVIKRDLEKCQDFSEFLIYIDKEIQDRCAKFPEQFTGLFCRPSPFMSTLMNGCIENLTDVTFGNKYNNYGIHGTAVATGADSIAAVEKLVFNGFTEPKELIKALEANFEGYDELRNKMLTKLPHMGNNDDSADYYACMLLNSFADALKPLKNDRGGIFRAGTGSANNYALARCTGATADGRKADDYLPANYSHTLNVKVDGPLSVISSFTKPELKKVINGGPLTIELASSAVTNDEGIAKTAYIVKKFIDLGGHQMQINVVNREKLLDAQEHPELYKNLVVRVWGWSGYFVELDKIYQDQIVQRTEHENL